MLSKIVDAMPRYSYGRACLVWALAHKASFQRDIDRAKEIIAGSECRTTWDAATWLQVGNICVDKQPNIAIACFRKAIEGNPSLMEAHYNLGTTLTGIDRPAEALPHLRVAMKLPRFRRQRVHFMYGYALLKLRRFKGAAQHLREAIKIGPPFSKAYQRLARVHEETGRYDLAIKVLSEGSEKLPGAHPLRIELAWLLATVPLASLRDGEKAVELARRVCDETDNSMPALLDVLAAAHAETKNYGKAVEVAKRALEIELSKPDATVDMDLVRQIQTHILLYKSGKPYRLRESR